MTGGGRVRLQRGVRRRDEPSGDDGTDDAADTVQEVHGAEWRCVVGRPHQHAERVGAYNTDDTVHTSVHTDDHISMQSALVPTTQTAWYTRQYTRRPRRHAERVGAYNTWRHGTHGSTHGGTHGDHVNVHSSLAPTTHGSTHDGTHGGTHGDHVGMQSALLHTTHGDTVHMADTVVIVTITY